MTKYDEQIFKLHIHPAYKCNCGNTDTVCTDEKMVNCEKCKRLLEEKQNSRFKPFYL